MPNGSPGRASCGHTRSLVDWACLWDTCAEASIPHGLPDEVSDFAAAMPAGHELHVGLYFSGYGAAPCRAVPSVEYGHDALTAALATTAVDGVMVYTFETPRGICPNATDRGCAVKDVFSAHGGATFTVRRRV